MTPVLPKALLAEVSRYLLVGASVFLLYFGLIFVMTDLLKIHYGVGVTLAYVLAVTCHYFLNRTFTFPGSRHSSAMQIRRYLGLLVINYVVTIVAVATAVEILSLSKYIGAAAGIVSTTAIGYLVSKFWIFPRTGQ